MKSKSLPLSRCFTCWQKRWPGRAGLALGLLLTVAAMGAGGENYQVLHQFVGSDGRGPTGRLLLFGESLYGVTSAGGLYNYGTVFKVNPDGSQYTILKHFTGGEESSPCGDLVVSGNTLYGTTGGGPDYAAGTVFKLNLDGSGYAVLKHFANNDGWAPRSGLVLEQNTLYGTTFHGGSNELSSIFGDGIVYRINTDGSDFEVLHYFTGNDGRFPSGALTLCGTTLYGTTAFGGPANNGTVFRIETTGEDFSQLFSFQLTNGMHPSSGLLWDGNALYGTTVSGGGSLKGVVFRVDAAGPTVLKEFSWTDGGNPYGLTAAGSTLYGATYSGGLSSLGILFGINNDGSNFRVLKSFCGTDGAAPSDLVLSGQTLYGTASSGGISNCGVIFGLSLAPAEIAGNPQTQTAESGAEVDFFTRAQGEPPLAYQWFFNETNVLTALTTNSLLQLSNVGLSDAGAYTVVVSNVFGTTTSVPALLDVISPVHRRAVLGLHFDGEVGNVLQLERSEVLKPDPQWRGFDSVTLASPSQWYFGLGQPWDGQQFYRAWHTNGMSSPARLGLTWVAEITLSGTIGEAVRLEYINQFGAIGAWSPLVTMTLTDSTNVYFDTSALGQPPRLYRIVTVP